MKYITKFNYGSTRGYQVRLPQIESGKYVHYNGLNFFFKKGKRTWPETLEAAKDWRYRQLEEMDALDLLEEKLSHKFDVPCRNTGRNTSGAIGVVYAEDEKKGVIYPGYKAYWSTTINGNRVQRTQQFSCNLYGDCDAFRLACEVRHEHCGIIYIKDRNAIPCLPSVEYQIDG